jgi:predicted AlkP superfamily pyrophosphatase or phosphodiesterase
VPNLLSAALALGLVLLLSIGAACVPGRQLPEPLGRAAFERMVCDLPHRYVERIRHGYLPGRSGNIQLVPREPNSMGTWYTHTGPWDYVQQVPLVFYGPGQVPALGDVGTRVTLADLAPTIAALIGSPFAARDGSVLREVIDGRTRAPPDLVLTMVWDSAGWNVLREHPDDWPFLRGLMEGGVSFGRATLGTSPSISASIHATIGTGAYPEDHGRTDHFIMLDDELVFIEDTGTADLLVPTMAERYDEAHGNEPIVGVVGSWNWHLGMIGQGALRPGGDRDIAVLWNENGWVRSKDTRALFRFPSYVRSIPWPTLAEVDRQDGSEDGGFFGYRLPVDRDAMDREDGAIDDAWFGRSIEEDLVPFGRKLAWSGWQTRVIESLIEGEGFGAGGPPDLLFVNYKAMDDVGHRAAWTMNSPEMGAALRSVDLATEQLVRSLDRHVGRGRWALVVLADHGATPSPEVSGGFQIDERELKADIRTAFGKEALVYLRPSQLWADQAFLGEEDSSLAQLATFLSRYTKGDNAEAWGIELPADEADDPLLAAAFPSEVLEGLDCGAAD